MIFSELNNGLKIVLVAIMETTKRKAKRISDRPIKKKAIDRNIYAGSEDALLKKIVEVVVKIIKKEIGL